MPDVIVIGSEDNPVSDPSLAHPERLLDNIPDPDTVRDWLARSVRQTSLLRSLLRVAERKAQYRDRQARTGREVACAS